MVRPDEGIGPYLFLLSLVSGFCFSLQPIPYFYRLLRPSLGSGLAMTGGEDFSSFVLHASSFVPRYSPPEAAPTSRGCIRPSLFAARGGSYGPWLHSSLVLRLTLCPLLHALCNPWVFSLWSSVFGLTHLSPSSLASTPVFLQIHLSLA